MSKPILSSICQQCAAKLGVPFFETSAKAGTNVEDAFLTMEQHLIEAKFVLQSIALLRVLLYYQSRLSKSTRTCCKHKIYAIRSQEAKSSKPATKSSGGKARLESGEGKKKKECCK